jgi:hypothetical protein
MNEKASHILSLLITLAGFAVIAFIYLAEPRSFSEVSSKGQVVLGTYGVNRQELNDGILHFRRDQFSTAREYFGRADPENQDPLTQFYTAYSYYRQGFGKFSNDDALFKSGLAAVDRVIALDPRFRVSDETLQLRTAAELKTELQDGLTITASDFNPMRLGRERK